MWNIGLDNKIVKGGVRLLNNIMFQGTASNVGKSIISAGICRVLWQDGYRVVPFKSQNMSLNSYIDKYGGEMGRAQVFQAEACHIEPRAYMNPILLKPSGNHMSQLLMNGRLVKNIFSSDYQAMKPDLVPWLEGVYNMIQKKYDIVVLEGAGSPVEININKLDISNMAMAKIADSPVVLVADIDRGGVFASVVGTLSLMSDEERARVKGVIINKFRGKKEYFEEGVRILEDIIKIPVLGVVPYQKLGIEEEDGVSYKIYHGSRQVYRPDTINVAVLKLDHMSNYTDFNIFEHIEGVNLSYVSLDQNLACYDWKEGWKFPDMLLIPGSKNTLGDMETLNQSPIKNQVMAYAEEGGLLIGICGGYQILGQSIKDDHALDGRGGSVKGLGLLDVYTVFGKEKKTSQVKWSFGDEEGYFSELGGSQIEGYETHLGTSIPLDEKNREVDKVDKIDKELEAKHEKKEDGGQNYIIRDGHIMGTYCHGIFDSSEFLSGLLNNIAKKKGLDKKIDVKNYKSIKEAEYDKLADLIRENVDMEKIYKIIFESK